MYDCPIKTFMQTTQAKMQEEYEGQVVMAVQKVGIDVNKEELIQAIKNDRQRYEAAYQRGWNSCERYYKEILARIHNVLVDADQKDGDGNG